MPSPPSARDVDLRRPVGSVRRVLPEPLLPGPPVVPLSLVALVRPAR